MTREAKKRMDQIDKDIAALAALDDGAIDTLEIQEVTDWEGGVKGRFHRATNKNVTVLGGGYRKRLRPPAALEAEAASAEARRSPASEQTLKVWPYISIIEDTVIKAAKQRGSFSTHMIHVLTLEVCVKLIISFEKQAVPLEQLPAYIKMTARSVAEDYFRQVPAASGLSERERRIINRLTSQFFKARNADAGLQTKLGESGVREVLYRLFRILSYKSR